MPREVAHISTVSLAMFCRLIPFRRKRRRIVCMAGLLVIVYILYQLTIDEYSFAASGRSSRKWTRRAICSAFQIRQKLCQEYFSHRIGGNLCQDLCRSGIVSLEPICQSKKEDTIVIFGKWKDKDIVLKTKRSSHSYKNLDSELFFIFQDSIQAFAQDPGHYRQTFANHIFEHIIKEVNFENLRDLMSPAEMLHHIYHPHSENNLSYIDMQTLWLLLQQEEFVKLQLLQETKHIPRVYGFCGPYYAIERVKDLEDFMSVFKRPPSWSTRVQVALELMSLIKELNRTLIGSLSHCDVQPGNFGLAKDGRVVALDLDTVFTAPQMDSFMAQGNCSSNRDCTFFDCMSVCDSGVCTSTVITNNLHVLCRDLLISAQGQRGLLHIIPAHQSITNELKSYLTKCAQGVSLPWQPQEESKLHQKIYNLLKMNLQN